MRNEEKTKPPSQKCDACKTTGVPMERTLVPGQEEPLTLCMDPVACRRRWQAAQ